MREPALPLQKERLRRRTVALVFLFYGLLLAEGPLRKWLVPGASNALVFVRDPVMLLILVAYARLGASRAMRRLLGAVATVAAALLACVAAQLATSPVPGLALAAGLRNYLLFVPLACVIRDTFTARDIARWVRFNLLIAGPVAALVVAQYRAGPSAFINAVPGGGNDGEFLLVEDVVRPYGLFSFTLGHSAYAAWMLGVVLAAVVGLPGVKIGRVLLAVGSLGVVAMGVFSGARTYWLFAACVLAAFLALAIMAGRPAHRRLAAAVVVGLALLGGGILAAVPSVATALLDRQATAEASEGATSDRVGRVVTDFVDELGRAPTFGAGLGAGTNIANYLSNGRTDHVLAEYELTRLVQELGPFFGLLVILARWALVAWFVALAMRSASRGNLQPACHLGFIAPVVLVHDITLQNSMIGIAWFAAGLFLASCRLEAPAGAAAPRPAPLPLRLGRPACA